MAQKLKSVMVNSTVCDGTFTLAPKWLEIDVASGLSLNGPLVIDYDEIGKFNARWGYVNTLTAQVAPQMAAFCRQSHDVKGQPCFGLTLYPMLNMIFNSDSERNAFIKDLEGLVKKAGYPDFKIL